MPRPGVTMPVVDPLAKLPVMAMASSTIVCDPRGVQDAVLGKRYAYFVGATAAATWGMLRIDLDTGTVSPCAAPPAAAAGAYVAARLAAVYVPLGTATENIPCVYVVLPLTLNPFMETLEYNCRTDVWTVRANIAGLAAPLATSLSLAHASGVYQTEAGMVIAHRNRFIYANGDAGVFGGAGLSNIAYYNMVTNAWVLFTGAGGARAAAPAAGSQLIWLPSSPDRLWSNRGGGSTVVDIYNFGTDAWGVAAFVPAYVMGDGTDFTMMHTDQTKIVFRMSSNPGVLMTYDVLGTRCESLATMDGSDGALHAGNLLCSWVVGGRQYIAVVPHSGNSVQRIRLIQ